MSDRTGVGVAVIDLGDFDDPKVQRSVAQFAPRKIGGQPLIVRMARRLSDCALVSGVFAVGSNIPSKFLTSGVYGLETINLPSCHGCERLCAVVDRTQVDWVVSVPANRPFVDSALVDCLLSRAMKTRECDYIGFASGAGDNLRAQRLGLAGEACHSDTLRRLRRNADRIQDADTIAGWLENAPGAYHLKFVPLPVALDRADLRFSVESEQDWDDVQMLCETVTEEDAEWQRVCQVVLSNDDLLASMASRNG